MFEGATGCSDTGNRDAGVVDPPQRSGWNQVTSLLMQAPAAIAVLQGPDHVFELVNPLYEQMVGRRAEDLLGRPGQVVLHRVTDGKMWRIFDRMYETGEPHYAREVALRRSEYDEHPEELHWYNVVSQPTFDRDGAVEGILVHAVDVTEQVEARQRVEELAAELESERGRLSLGPRVGKIGTFDRDVVKDQVIWPSTLEALYV